MTALKLFVSHSSRLDDVEHKYTRDDRNWCLLEDTCRAIRTKYGERVDILVDKDGLHPGDDWNHQLNVWLAECHVAIILFSKRAIEKSEWVAKEAAVLSWRAELNKEFTLIPVMLDGESTPEDLAQDFFGALQITRSQCIQGAQTADDIVAGIVEKLGEPEDLAAEHPSTPLEMLQGGVAKLLGESVTEASLKSTLEALEVPVLADGKRNRQRYADALARRLLSANPDRAQACFNTFQLGIDGLKPDPPKEQALNLFRLVRSLWVEPGAAAHLPLALQHQKLLILRGCLITQADSVLETEAYTLERYIERAWPGSKLYIRVTTTGVTDLEAVKAEIRHRFLGGGLPPGFDGAMQDQAINLDPKTIVLVVASREDSGGSPDALFLRELEQLEKDYQKLVVIIALDATCDALPDTLRSVEPPLEPICERAAFLAERSAKNYLNQKYGTG